MTENVVPGWAGRARRRSIPWTDADKAALKRLWAEGAPGEEIAEALGRDATQIYNKAHDLGLPRRKRGKAKRQHRADPTGQRRKIRMGPASGPRITLEPFDPRSRAGTTVFPTSVQPASRMVRILKSGEHSAKIGKVVAKGHLRGAPIFTLTLEERATCPRECKAWAICYGNNMPFAQRIWDDGTLTKRLWAELASIAADHPRFLVRLHVLGDFYSPEYVGFWRGALEEFPGLNIFGFTARRPPDPIGLAVAELVRDFYDRARIRFSGLAMDEDGAVVIERPEDAIGILCPAEDDPVRSCATCGLCWHSNRTISFMRH